MPKKLGSTHKAPLLTTMLRESCSGYHLPTTTPKIRQSIEWRNQNDQEAQIRRKVVENIEVIDVKRALRTLYTYANLLPCDTITAKSNATMLDAAASSNTVLPLTKSSIIKDRRCYIGSIS
ncbi:hypothetical protein GJ496_009289 [Pomphorhynchus laevis]|nr:hypothetical protein GJ496_009289 [Pomphorhynchus laevis]